MNNPVDNNNTTTTFNTYDDDREISLKDLFRFLFKKWKVMIVWAVLFAAIACGYKAATYAISRSGYPSEYSTALKSYNAEVKSYQETLDGYNETISDYNDQLSKTTDPDKKSQILNSINSVDNNKSNLKEPEKPKVLSNTLSVSGFVKMGLVGAVIGWVIYCVLRAIRYVTDNKVHDGDELTDIYGLRKLGNLTDQKKSKNGDDSDKESDTYGMISALIDNLNDTDEDVAVTGPVSENQLKNQAANLGQNGGTFEYVPISNVTEDPVHYKAISKFKYVVLVVMRDSSKLADTDELVKYLSAANVQILGYLVIR